MHPSVHAKANPAKPAIIMSASGETISYGELDRRSNQVAQLLRSRGIGVGDTVALCLENHPWFHALAWGAQRSGVHYVAISSRLTAPEIAYILADSGAKLLLGSAYLAPTLDEVARLAANVPQLRLDTPGAASLDDLAARRAFHGNPVPIPHPGQDRPPFRRFVTQRRRHRGLRQPALVHARHRRQPGAHAVAERDGAGLVQQQRVHVARRLHRAP